MPFSVEPCADTVSCKDENVGDACSIASNCCGDTELGDGAVIAYAGDGAAAAVAAAVFAAAAGGGCGAAFADASVIRVTKRESEAFTWSLRTVWLRAVSEGVWAATARRSSKPMGV
jgi:hypothetical protein